jgi:hypothetical protein
MCQVALLHVGAENFDKNSGRWVSGDLCFVIHDSEHMLFCCFLERFVYKEVILLKYLRCIDGTFTLLVYAFHFHEAFQINLVLVDRFTHRAEALHCSQIWPVRMIENRKKIARNYTN